MSAAAVSTVMRNEFILYRLGGRSDLLLAVTALCTAVISAALHNGCTVQGVASGMSGAGTASPCKCLRVKGRDELADMCPQAEVSGRKRPSLFYRGRRHDDLGCGCACGFRYLYCMMPCDDCFVDCFPWARVLAAVLGN